MTSLEFNTDYKSPDSCAESTSSLSEQEISEVRIKIPEIPQNKKNKSTPEKPVSQWNVDDVVRWLNLIPFPSKIKQEYAQKMVESAVHGPLLLKLDNELLVDIGIERKVHRQRILTDIDILKQHRPEYVSSKNNINNMYPPVSLPLVHKVDKLFLQQNEVLCLINQLQDRFETMPYWNRVRMVEKLGLADTESISRHFEDLDDGASRYPSIYVNCEKSDHIIIGHYTCFGKLYGKPFYVKSCKTKKLLLYYRSDLDKKRWRFTRTNKHSLADFCEKRKYQARTKESADHEAAHLIPRDTCWAVWDGRTDHNWQVIIEISDHQPYLGKWVHETYFGGKVLGTMELCQLCASFVFVPPDELTGRPKPVNAD
eukprot:UN24539